MARLRIACRRRVGFRPANPERLATNDKRQKTVATLKLNSRFRIALCANVCSSGA
jgi:hypothetical protein